MAGQKEAGTTKLVVVAIDYGTTYSGYAFSLRHKPLQIFTNKAWAAGTDSLISLKTSTCLLLKPEKEFDSFGYEAEEKYAELVEDDKHSGWYFFSRFKMMLYNTSSITEDTMLPDISGKELPAVDIFAHSIRYLNEHFQKALENQIGERLDRQIQYVLTVPAIWDDKAKIFMRKAAVMAGIQSEHLRMALEPEAASLWCQMYAKEIHVHISRKYIVVDLGGGTADITVQKQDEEDNLKELHQATGGPWGGNTVENNLMNMLSQIFGEDALQALKDVDMGGYLSILRSFETSKRNMKKHGKNIRVYIPPKLLCEKQFSMWKISLTKNRNAAIKRKINKLGLTGKCVAEGDRLKFDMSVVHDWFRYPVDSLVQHLQSLFKQDNTASVETILLVGGFADSLIVQENISGAFPEKKVIIPSDPELAVVKDAVIFGHFPRRISARMSKFFYGLQTSAAFDPNKHPENKRVRVYGQDVCCQIFSEIVAQGEDLSYGKEFSQERIAADVAQITATETLFASTSPNTFFVDEKGCVEIGKVRITYPKSDNIDDKKCTVYLSFWDTEIKFRVEVKGSTDMYENRFDRL